MQFTHVIDIYILAMKNTILLLNKFTLIVDYVYANRFFVVHGTGTQIEQMAIECFAKQLCYAVLL